MKEIDEKERALYAKEVIERILYALEHSTTITDLSDIGNEIGSAVGSVTCMDGKDKNIWSFQKDDFENGFEHGYSLMNGTH